MVLKSKISKRKIIPLWCTKEEEAFFSENYKKIPCIEIIDGETSVVTFKKKTSFFLYYLKSYLELPSQEININTAHFRKRKISIMISAYPDQQTFSMLEKRASTNVRSIKKECELFIYWLYCKLKS